MGHKNSCCFCVEKEAEFTSTEDKGCQTKWEPQDWEVEEWYAILKENDTEMYRLNILRMKAKQKEIEEEMKEENRQHDQMIREREAALEERRKELKVKENELKEKEAALEIAIRVNEVNLETRFGNLMKRLEELETATRNQRNPPSPDFDMKQRSTDQMNSSGNDENSTDSDHSN